MRGSSWIRWSGRMWIPSTVIPCNLHRAEDHQPQPALDGGHHHRDLRLPAPAVFLDRDAALSSVRPRDLAAVGGPDREQRDGDASGRARDGDGAHRPRPQRRVQKRAGEAGAARIHTRAHRWRDPAAVRGRGIPYPARQTQEPHHRSGRGSIAGESRGSRSGWRIPLHWP